MSPEFAEETALCLNANGIPTYRFDSLRPVPMLSFATRTLGCTAGVMITASHNPPAYNGYKVYWDDGAQVTAPLDKEILDEVNAVTDYATVKTMSHDDAVAAGLYHTIGKEIDDQYMATIQALVLDHDSIAKAAGLKIVYTPLHGTGNLPVRRVLSELGFRNVFVVPEQEKPDGSFPTVKSPNPEDKAAFTLALGYAKEQGADLVLATDPDADRLGVFALDRGLRRVQVSHRQYVRRIGLRLPSAPPEGAGHSARQWRRGQHHCLHQHGPHRDRSLRHEVYRRAHRL